MKPLYLFLFVMAASLSGCKSDQGAFPYAITEEVKDRELSAAMHRSFHHYPAPFLSENELYSQFRYTELNGFDYNDHDGTITRRDPSKILLENGKYYVWYTKRHTSVKPVGGVFSKGYQNTPPEGETPWNDTIPSVDWDLAEIWYATSEDGFNWTEQGVAVTRPPKPVPGWRSVATPDILKYKGKYYLYYQAFVEAPGTRGDYCPVGASWSESPDGPWTHVDHVVVDTGAEGEWDQFAVQDPTPLVHNDQIYVYYKGAFNRPNTVFVAVGLAISDGPLGPFEKHPLNPVLNSGHEICFWPFKDGVAAFAIHDGNEHFTIQYAEDWVNFEIAAITEMMPLGGNAFIPDAFADNGNGRGITWGICFFRAQGDCCFLARFDCDLSLDLHDPELKRQKYHRDPAFYFSYGLSDQQLSRIDEENRKLIGP
jgi:hypothetical protein